jgi:hypothetical protein
MSLFTYVDVLKGLLLHGLDYGRYKKRSHRSFFFGFEKAVEFCVGAPNKKLL